MARREDVNPTVESKKHGGDDTEEFTHDAYGTVTMTTVHGGGTTLFGSDIGHGDRICISVQRAKLHRNLSRDWIHGASLPLIEFEMSHAQFAQFITSNGNGGGTPVTLRYAAPRGAQLEQMPGIKNIETKHETFRNEIAAATNKRLERAMAVVNELGAALETGKLKITDARKIHSSLAHELGSLPGSMKFVVGQAEEALEKATSDSKIEVESYVNSVAQRLGISAISDLAAIEDKMRPQPVNLIVHNQRCDASPIGTHAYSRAINQEYPRKCVHCNQPEQK